jgi:2-methylisocitrate lyase-like PEP mutase family enzyme
MSLNPHQILARSKCAKLRTLLESADLEFLMEAHSGISARIVEEAGFKGVWASGLGISASLGVRDNNEASWTQVVDTVEFMADATRVPILLDGDTGYGNFNNMRRLVRKLEQRGGSWGLHRGQGVPEEQQLYCGRAAAARGHRRVLWEDQGGQGYPA